MEKIDLMINGILLFFLVFAYCGVHIDSYKISKPVSLGTNILLFFYYVILPILVLGNIAMFMIKCIEFFGGCNG
jgi:hypothetical protein